MVQIRSGARLSQFSEPEPDVVLFKPRADFYRAKAAGPQAVYLVVEVSNTSLEFDRHEKVPLHARQEIPEVWIVDLRMAGLHVYRTPKGGEYTQTFSTAEPGVLTPVMLGAVSSPEPLTAVEVDLRRLLQS